MNAALNNAINTLATVNPSLIPAVMAQIGEEAQLKLANTLLGTQPAQAMASVIPMQPTSYQHGAPVVVPWDGEVVKCFVVAVDLNGNGSVRDGWYVLLIADESHKNYESFTSFPLDMIWPENELGRMAAQKRAQEEEAAETQKKADKESHKLELLAGLPMSEENLTALSAQDKNSLLSLLGQSPFEIKGDRVPYLIEAQAAFIKTKEGKEKIAQAKAIAAHNAAAAKVKAVKPAPAKSPTPAPAAKASAVAQKIAPVLKKAGTGTVTKVVVPAPAKKPVPAPVLKKGVAVKK